MGSHWKKVDWVKFRLPGSSLLEESFEDKGDDVRGIGGDAQLDAFFFG